MSKKHALEQEEDLPPHQDPILQCCSGFSSCRPTKSGKTHEKQSISPCTAHFEKYHQAVDLMESGLVLEAVSILKLLLADYDADNSTPRSNPSLHNLLIKASMKLATAYQILSRPTEAMMTLDQIFLPNQRLHISYGHNLFGELTALYSTVKKELASKRISKITSSTEFRILYVGTCLYWLGRECMKLEKHAPAVRLLETSVHEAKKYGDDLALSSYSLKQLYIQIHLDLTRCHIALGSLPSAKSTLDNLQASERSLSLNYVNPKFLEAVALKTAMDNWNSNSPNHFVQSLFRNIPEVDVYTIKHFPQCCYQALCVPLDSSIEMIHSSFRTLCKILHPDKGGNTVLMQRLLLAYETLKDQDSRKHYDKTCEVMHPHFSNQMFLTTD